MKSFKEISEQHADEGRFKPVKPHNVASKGLVSPRSKVDSADAKLKEDMDICNHCQHDPCICDDSHGFVTETKRMSNQVKLQRAFEREQAKHKPSPQDAAWEKTKKQLERPDMMDVLKRLKNEGYNDYHNNRTGFAKRQREDDEYHVPDSMRQTHTIRMKLSKDGGEVQHKQMNVTTAHGVEHAKQHAHAEAKKQGWTVHEEVEQNMNEQSASKIGQAQDEVPFDKPYHTVKDPVKTDKSGAKHTPMSRARDLARKAAQRQAGLTKKLDESRKAEIVKEIVKGKKKSNEKFEPNPELGSTVVKADN